MSITKTFGTGVSVGSGDITPVPPAGGEPGDTYIVFAMQVEPGSDFLSMSADWTKAGNGYSPYNQNEVAAFVCRRGDVDPSFVVSGNAVRRKKAIIALLKGAYSASLSLDSYVFGSGTFTNPNITVPGTWISTNSQAQFLLLAAWSFGSCSVTVPGTWTQEHITTGDLLYVASRIQSDAGETASQPCTVTGAWDNAVCGLLLSIVPADEPVVESIVSQGSPSFGTGNLTPGIPPRLLDGDLLLCCVTRQDETTVVSMDSPAWSAFFGSGTCLAFSHRHAVGESIDTTVSLSGAGYSGSSAIIIALRGIGDFEGSPVHAQDGSFEGVTATPEVPSITTSVPTHNVIIASANNGIWAEIEVAEPQYRRRSIAIGSQPDGKMICLFDVRPSSPGAIGTRIVTVSGTPSYASVGHIAFLLDVSGGDSGGTIGGSFGGPGSIIGGGGGGGTGGGAGTGGVSDDGGGGGGAGPGDSLAPPPNAEDGEQQAQQETEQQTQQQTQQQTEQQTQQQNAAPFGLGSLIEWLTSHPWASIGGLALLLLLLLLFLRKDKAQ